jgi:hypothetical protein
VTALRTSIVDTPSPGLCKRIRRHRRAFLAYDRFGPFGDPADARFSPARLGDLDRWQKRENRYRLDLLAHPVRTLADVRTKAGYLLTYPGSDYLISGPDELLMFLRSLIEPCFVTKQ